MDLRSLVIKGDGAWLCENKKWPERIDWVYTKARYWSSPSARPVTVTVPSLGYGLVAVDLAVTDVWTGCPRYRHPTPDVPRLACYFLVRATSGAIFGERFDRPDGVFIEVRATAPDYGPRDELASVIFDVPPEGTQWCRCAEGVYVSEHG